MNQRLRLGARGSLLSRWQAEHVKALLIKKWPNVEIEIKIFQTRGDQVTHIPLPQIGQKGLFTAELERALLDDEIDFAVHSQKDLPVDDPTGLTTAAVLLRESPLDVLVSRFPLKLFELPRHSVIGTSSLRRSAQLLYARPDLKTIDIRGNVDTRIQKALDPKGPYDGIVIAHAGLVRLQKDDVISEVIDVEYLLPAPAQGALAVQCRAQSPVYALLNAVNHFETQLCTLAERAFLKGLGGGCSLPIAALARVQKGQLVLRGAVFQKQGIAKIDLENQVPVNLEDVQISILSAHQLGFNLAQKARSLGADKLL